MNALRQAMQHAEREGEGGYHVKVRTVSGQVISGAISLIADGVVLIRAVEKRIGSIGDNGIKWEKAEHDVFLNESTIESAEVIW